MSRDGRFHLCVGMTVIGAVLMCTSDAMAILGFAMLVTAGAILIVNGKNIGS